MMTLTTRFADNAARICDLRAQDREFDEICSDFEELSQSLARLEGEATPQHQANGSSLLTDIRDTLAALDEEISSYLEIVTSREGDQE